VGASTPVVFGPAKVYTHPDPPVNVRVEAGHRTITVSWDPPADDGGDAVSNYQVLMVPSYARYDTGTATSVTIGPLDDTHLATDYTFTVRAYNRANESEESAPAGPIRPLYIAPQPTRIAGADRYATSAAVSRDAFQPGVPVAYLASGANFPDALAGAAAAGKQGGPVLLTTPTALPPTVAAELARLKPQRIVVLGGPSVIYDSVIGQARRVTAATVDRIYGADRYATSAAISSRAFEPGVDIVYIATGASFADALAAAPVAAAQGGPVLLSRRTAIPPSVLAELKRLKPKVIMLVGGDGVLSDELWTVVSALAPSIGKASGADRFETAEMLMNQFPSWQPTAYIASALNFPDALSAGAAAAAHGAPVLMTRQNSLPDYARSVLSSIHPRRVVVVGGTAIVGPAVAAAAQPYMVG
jgi:putative cell wall-binding protein